MMTDIILHHYDASPFTQKALRMLGLKNLEWRSVVTPMLLPKPDLVCLTGGYRGTPVMQIGADIYIDTQCIARELERRFPEPTFFPAGDAGLAFALVKWSDEFFQAGLKMALALLGPDWDTAFREDRQALFVHLDFDSMDAETGHAMAQLQASAGLLNAQLADGRPFLTGDHAGLADIQAFSVLWFTRAAMPITEKLFRGFSHLPAWEARVAELGEGNRQQIDAAEAHRIAQESQPDLTSDIAGNEAQSLEAGMSVKVMPDDFSLRGTVEGVLLRTSAVELAIHRSTDDFGDLVIHFPRLGYRVEPLAG
jgi:glutathione S-transferase